MKTAPRRWSVGLMLELVGIAAIALGVAIRIRDYLFNRPLYVDEAMLALNIARRSFVGLTHPLAYDQTGPILYLWILKFATLVGGVSELSLRFPLLLAGIAVLILARDLARQLVGENGAPLVVVLLAIAGPFLYYSADSKQYGGDALATVAVCLATLRVLGNPGPRRDWIVLGIVGAVSVLASTPSIFVLGAAGAALVVGTNVGNDSQLRQRIAALGAAWLATFAVVYFAIYREATQNSYLNAFWEGTFLRPDAPDRRGRIWSAMAAMLHIFPFGVSDVLVALLGVGLIGGTVALWRRRGIAVTVLVAGPLALAVAASMLGKYPMFDRLLLFFAPLEFAIIVAAILEAPRLLGARAGAIAGGGLSVALLALYLHPAVENDHQRLVAEQGRNLIRMIVRNAGDEPVYVIASGIPAWVWYTTDWQHPDTTRLDWFERINKSDGLSAHNGPTRGGPVPETEGEDLIDWHNGLTAIIGVRTGMQFRARLGRYPSDPDTGWAAHEIRRLTRASTPNAWIFGTHVFDYDLGPLLVQLQRFRDVPLTERNEGRAIALHVRMSRDTLPRAAD